MGARLPRGRPSDPRSDGTKSVEPSPRYELRAVGRSLDDLPRPRARPRAASPAWTALVCLAVIALVAFAAWLAFWQPP